MSQLFDCRDAFARTLEDLAASDPRVVALINDSLSSTKLGAFAKRFPAKLINVGIAEQNMVGLASGLANGGKLPFVCGASCFLTGRAMEQVKVDLAYTRANVKLCGMSSGFAYGELGATHHSIEDLAWTRAIPYLTVIAPADPLETEQAMRWAAAHDGPVFLRLSRIGVPAVHPADYQFTPGRAATLRQGRHLTFIANGTLVCRALEAAETLSAEGIEARVLNLSSLRPLDTEAIVAAARETGAIVTAEEANIHGGLGGAVAEVVATRCPVPMRILGVPDTFAPTGSVNFLFEHFGLTPAALAAAARDLLSARQQREAVPVAP